MVSRVHASRLQVILRLGEVVRCERLTLGISNESITFTSHPLLGMEHPFLS